MHLGRFYRPRIAVSLLLKQSFRFDPISQGGREEELLFMEHFHDKLVPVQREVRGKGFAIHVQVVDVISALQGKEIQLNLLQLTTD